jgi:hypothetical protein
MKNLREFLVPHNVLQRETIAIALILAACLPAAAVHARWAVVTVLVAVGVAVLVSENATLAFACMLLSSMFGVFESPVDAACACRGDVDYCQSIDGSVPLCHATVAFRWYLFVSLSLGVALWLVNVARLRKAAVFWLSGLLVLHAVVGLKVPLYHASEPFCRASRQSLCTVAFGGLLVVAMQVFTALLATVRAYRRPAEGAQQQPTRRSRSNVR